MPMKSGQPSRLQSRFHSLVSLVLLIAVFALVAWASTQYSFEQDWTRSGRHTLSEASRQVLSELEKPIRITAYARDDKPLRDALRSFIERYRRAKADISLEFVNPDVVPDETRELGISVNGELIVHYGERSEHVKQITEESLTNAMRRLARNAERWLVFMEGHGERNPLGDGNHDLGVWAQQLRNSGYRIQPVNLNEVQALPDNTSVLVLAGPQVDLFPGEVRELREYLEAGGNLLWLADQGASHGLETLTELLPVTFPEGTVVDFAGQLLGIDDPSMVVTTPSLYGDHTVVDEFEFTTLYPTAGVVAADSDDDGDWTIEPLVNSGDHTWLETGPLEGEVSFDEGVEREGPLPLGVALSRTLNDSKEQRIVVMGDGDFLANTYVSNGGNLEFGNRIVNWLSADDDLITIPPKTAPDTVLELPNTASIVIGVGFLIVLPFGLLAAGLIIWWRRRQR